LSFGAFVGRLGGAAHRGRGVEVRDLVAVEREDPGLPAASEIRERAALNIDGEHMGCFVDRVGPEVSDAALDDRSILFQRPADAIVGGKIGEIGAHHGNRETAVRIDHHRALRIGTKGQSVALVRGQGDERPCPDEPLFVALCRLSSRGAGHW